MPRSETVPASAKFVYQNTVYVSGSRHRRAHVRSPGSRITGESANAWATRGRYGSTPDRGAPASRGPHVGRARPSGRATPRGSNGVPVVVDPHSMVPRPTSGRGRTIGVRVSATPNRDRHADRSRSGRCDRRFVGRRFAPPARDSSRRVTCASFRRRRSTASPTSLRAARSRSRAGSAELRSGSATAFREGTPPCRSGGRPDADDRPRDPPVPADRHRRPWCYDADPFRTPIVGIARSTCDASARTSLRGVPFSEGRDASWPGIGRRRSSDAHDGSTVRRGPPRTTNGDRPTHRPTPGGSGPRSTPSGLHVAWLHATHSIGPPSACFRWAYVSR